MQAFDFDNTLYKGESAFDFALFLMLKKKRLLKYLPKIMKLLWKYEKCKITNEEFLKEFNSFTEIVFKNKDWIKEQTVLFWKKNEHKLYPHMLEKIKQEDYIITASPDFLIEPIKDKINTNHFLCTETDLQNGKITYLNFNKNKVKKFIEIVGKKKIENFYTDSYNDKPLMDYAKHAFLVKKGKVEKIK